MTNKTRYIVLFTISLLFAECTNAQLNSKHMKFNGISMGYDINVFREKLKKQKYEFKENAYGIDYYKGYLGTNPVTLMVPLLANTKTVSTVQMVFHYNKKLSVAFLKSDFKAMREFWIKTFGKPTVDMPYKSDLEKMSILTNNTSVTTDDNGKAYIVSWEYPAGEITLILEKTLTPLSIHFVDLDNHIKNRELIDKEFFTE